MNYKLSQKTWSFGGEDRGKECPPKPKKQYFSKKKMSKQRVKTSLRTGEKQRTSSGTKSGGVFCGWCTRMSAKRVEKTYMGKCADPAGVSKVQPVLAGVITSNL